MNRKNFFIVIPLVALAVFVLIQGVFESGTVGVEIVKWIRRLG